ncbi:hypothetical protein CRE_22519 [Caenorhabditis remanei]|uniref:Uncharacterized protein n=1 Tax=Caenorhabditis remanei TaxID=31234 RepID=E3MU65_CAERE|nr:hypothetical protein CRE_22519 [Caenorhabditis remanei]
MYGSFEDFEENLEIFRNFEMNHLIWGNRNEFFSTRPLIYESLNHVLYVTKMDACIILQNIMLPYCWNSDLNTVLNLQKRIFALSYNVGRTLQFAKIDGEIIIRIKYDVHTAYRVTFDEPEALETLANCINDDDFASVINHFQESSSAWKDQKIYNQATLAALHPEMEPMARAQEFASLYMHVVTDDCIRKNYSMFRGTPPLTVRLFEDGDVQFVMVAELVDALNKISMEKLKYKDRELLVGTMSWRAVMYRFGDQIKHFEFIRTPIRRAKHKAVPVRSHSNNIVYVLAADALIEFFRNAIFGLRFFQMPEDVRRSARLDKVLKKLDKCFSVEFKSIYFLQADWSESLQAALDDEFELENLPDRDVRGVSDYGFTVYDLREELRYLKLHLVFPDIFDYMKVVHQHVNSVKKSEFLRTCDMFDAIEMCQLVCILNRWPKFKQVIHNQKACHRVIGIRCEWCEETEREVEATEFPSFDVTEEPEIVLPPRDFSSVALIVISILFVFVAYFWMMARR